MDRPATEFTNSGLPSPYSTLGADNRSEGSPADHASVQYSVKPEPYQYPVKPEPYPPAATPTSEYDYSSHFAQRPRADTMAQPQPSPHAQPQQQQPSPSLSNHYGRNDEAEADKSESDNGVPIDPNIAGPSPSYGYAAHSPYAHAEYSPHGPPPMYAQQQPRPDWTGYGQHAAGMAPGHPVYASANGGTPQRSNQVYSFVPIPGAQQHKRPRRRYEEIERMYKCGWQGCEKAYGTLNHLNAHVTMQSHGTKRTPEEFKEIRKDWKARKKEEENARKADEERSRVAQASAQNGGGQRPDGTPTSAYDSGSVQLPPIGFQGQGYPAPPPGSVGQPGMAEYPGTHMYQSYQPHSPYGANPPMYGQGSGPPPSH